MTTAPWPLLSIFVALLHLALPSPVWSCGSLFGSERSARDAAFQGVAELSQLLMNTQAALGPSPAQARAQMILIAGRLTELLRTDPALLEALKQGLLQASFKEVNTLLAENETNFFAAVSFLAQNWPKVSPNEMSPFSRFLYEQWGWEIPGEPAAQKSKPAPSFSAEIKPAPKPERQPEPQEASESPLSIAAQIQEALRQAQSRDDRPKKRPLPADFPYSLLPENLGAGDPKFYRDAAAVWISPLNVERYWRARLDEKVDDLTTVQDRMAEGGLEFVRELNPFKRGRANYRRIMGGQSVRGPLFLIEHYKQNRNDLTFVSVIQRFLSGLKDPYSGVENIRVALDYKINRMEKIFTFRVTEPGQLRASHKTQRVEVTITNPKKIEAVATILEKANGELTHETFISLMRALRDIRVERGGVETFKESDGYIVQPTYILEATGGRLPAVLAFCFPRLSPLIPVD